MTRAPDLVEPVVAFRSWRLVDGSLTSPYVHERWEGGVVVARCPQQGAGHEAPAPGCRCGIHAYFEPRSAVPVVDARRVPGIVAVWGRLEVHPQGVRAQYAQIRALATSPAWSSWHRDGVAAVAERLEVALVPEEALAATALEYGSPLPAVLR